MKPQGKKLKNVPKAESRSFLPCSEDVIRGSALGFEGSNTPTPILLETLAKLIVEVYFYDRDNH